MADTLSREVLHGSTEQRANALKQEKQALLRDIKANEQKGDSMSLSEWARELDKKEHEKSSSPAASEVRDLVH